MLSALFSGKVRGVAERMIEFKVILMGHLIIEDLLISDERL